MNPSDQTNPGEIAMLELSTGPFTARIVPEIGGIVTALEWRAPDGKRHKLLHAPDGAVPTTAHSNMFGTWAMVPFANRAFDCLVDDGERAFTVPANDRSGNIHGFGRQSAWTVLGKTRGHTVLEHRRTEGPDPYRYRATQDIALDDAGMTITMAVTNEADTALPYGIGHHPWFPCAPDTRLGMTAAGALVFGEAFRATGSALFSDGGPYADKPVFAREHETAWSLLGWNGVARIETPSTGLAITLTASENFSFPVVWAPLGADFLCVEPQSHAIGSPSEAAARAVSPLTRLQPGETLEGWLRIVPDTL
jgi:aldose 1-epimerase